MLGLLGTVRGMIKAFFQLQGQTASVNAITLSRGVGEALSTTLFGLAVGIAALLFYSIIKARATRATQPPTKPANVNSRPCKR